MNGAPGGPVFMLAALDAGQVVAVAPAGTPLDLDDPAWSRPARGAATQLAASWPGPVQPAALFQALPEVTVMLLADGTSHRFLIEAPQGAAARFDHDPGPPGLLADFDLGPAPPEVPRAYPWQIAFAFSVPERSGSRITYSVPGAGPAAPASNLAAAVMERQAILNRIRELCTGPKTFDAGGTAVRAADVLAILDDPDPLGRQ